MEAEKVNNSTDFSGFFKCVTNKGVILSGKKFEMVFEYTPELTGKIYLIIHKRNPRILMVLHDTRL